MSPIYDPELDRRIFGKYAKLDLPVIPLGLLAFLVPLGATIRDEHPLLGKVLCVAGLTFATVAFVWMMVAMFIMEREARKRNWGVGGEDGWKPGDPL